VTVPDREAARRLDALARAHQPALEAFGLKLCGNAQDAHDLVQDTFERALRAQEPPRTNERAWLFTILHHLFIDRYRRKTRGPRLTSIDDIDVAAAEPPPPPAWASVTPEQLQAALGQLDEEFAAAYRLHAIEGRSYLEIAQQTGSPIATIGTRILRARRKLRAILEQKTGGDE
jgi:RNA polymerase sigma-70 factor (ECF subfamily)